MLGERPKGLLLLLVPTFLALWIDVVLRGSLLAGYALQGKAIYASSLLVSAAFWALPLWGAARLWGVATAPERSRGRLVARILLAAFFAAWVFPIATCSYVGQVVYHHVVHAYVGRDTVRLGFAMRGTVRDWFVGFGSLSAAIWMVLGGAAFTTVIALAARRAAPEVRGGVPWLLVVTFPASLFVFWIDMVDSRFLQASLPDDCFVHGLVHLARVGITGKGTTSRGITLRTPAPLPALPVAAHRPNVVLVMLESVRFDTLCSDPASCQARFLDEVAPDRIPLGLLTTPTPGTFGACMVLWTGQPVTVTPKQAHAAPVLWEIARAEGYRTAYVTSQNFQFENFGAFVQNAGIDVKVSAVDLGGLRQEQLGAPDERAVAELLGFAHEASGPWFGVLHLSNTHAPYRVDPELQPFTPHGTDPLGDSQAFYNHYRNSVLLMERTLAGFLRELRSLPTWDDTVVVLVSDHGEQFRERGGLYHLHSLYDEEVRVPGFLLAGPKALDAAQRAALATYHGHRTYLADVNATLVDLFGAGAERRSLPFANPGARTLLAPWRRTGEPVTLMSTVTPVWDADVARNGAMSGTQLLAGSPGSPWQCFDMAGDAEQRRPLGAERCAPVLRAAVRVFE
ncbi:MAG: Choline-sulfatase [Labilithrix sp.]|nr:Choline-sulfatase [Labilithrix sp.]